MIKTRVLHVVPSLHPACGGPSRSVPQLTDALEAVKGIIPTLISQSGLGEPIVETIHTRNLRVPETGSSLTTKLGLPLRRELAVTLSDGCGDLLHGHGVWHPVNHWTAWASRRWNIPLVIQPRGMLEPWAIQHKGWKKRLALRLYQQRDLATAQVLVATAEKEYGNLRALGLRQPIAIIPNGVQLPAANELPARTLTAGVQRTVFFLGRVYPVKGLLNLIEAWAQVGPIGWRLRIAGPDETSHLAEVLALAREAGVSETIEYVGEVDGADKTAMYESADLFVLPSFTENFGLVVAEALAHGLPVITTQGTPWADLPAFGCGWWIPIGVDPLANALREAMALSDDERAAMGARGLVYVRRYDWSVIAEDMAAVYRWVLGHGAQPDCVRLD